MTAELLLPETKEKTSIRIVKDKIPKIRKERPSELTDDPHLQELVSIFSKKFKNTDQFVEAAELMKSFISLNMSGDENPPISQETAQEFYNKVITDYEERRTTFPLPVHYVKFDDPHTKSGGRIYKRDEGHHMLWPHMVPTSSPHNSELHSLLNQFEDPATKFGGQLVLTLKDLEISRQKESIPFREPISIDTTRPRELRPNTTVELSA